MPKRRRSRSSDRTRAAKISVNPFLPSSTVPEVNSSGVAGDDEMLQHVLTFVNLSREKTMSPECEVSLFALLLFLSKKVAPGAGALAPTEISLLLLPWAIKQLLSTSSSNDDLDRIVWETLAVCLEILLRSDDPTFQQTLSQKILTQSTLFKLVPKVALFAVGSEGDKERVLEAPSNVSRLFRSNKNESINEESVSNDDMDEASGSDNDSATRPKKSPRLLAALSYKLLTEKLFRPTLDVACKSLLLPIVAAMHLEDQYARARILAQEHTLAGRDGVGKMVVLSTLKLIDILQCKRKANPKTTFQLLATRSVLLAVSRVYFFFQQDFDGLILSDIDFFEPNNEGQSLVRKILYDGYFNPQHHVEGFRSLLLRSEGTADMGASSHAAQDQESGNVKTNTKKSQYQCYQEGLLSLMNDVLSQSSQTSEGENEVTNVRDAVWIVPILMRGFLEQVQVWGQQQEKDSRKKRTIIIGDEVVALQFQMFMQLALPLRKLVAGSTANSEVSTSSIALRSLRETLSLVLHNDAYVYAQDTQGRKQFSFLDGIVREMLELSETADDYVGLELLSDAVHVLGLLAKLNYLLLHERLVPVVSFSLSCTDGRLRPQVLDFLVGAVDTYRQLREQNHLFSSFLEVLKIFTAKKGGAASALMESLLNEPALASAFASAVQESPVLQTQAVFETINAWIFSACEDGPVASDCAIQSLAVVVQLTVIAVRNVRVDSSTAIGVASFCELFANMCIKALVKGTGTAAGPLVSPALTLCGWVIDLHTRCVFWLGNSAQLAIPPEIMQILNSASTTFRKSSQHFAQRRSTDANDSIWTFYPFLDELLFLATHRLQQLHTLIHIQERMELETTGAEKMSTALIAEAEELATFVVQVAERQRDPASSSKRPRWTIIARSFASWVPYAKDHHMDWFLDWMLSMVAINPASPWLPVESMGYRLEYYGLDEEIEVAKSLINDASFLENERVSVRLGLVTLSCVSGWIMSILSQWSTGDPMADKVLRSLVSSVNITESWTRSPLHMLVDLISTNLSSDRTSREEKGRIIEKLKRAILPLMLFNGMQLPMQAPGDTAVQYIDKAFRLDHVFRSLANGDAKVDRAVFPLIAALRLSIVKAIQGLPDKSFVAGFGSGNEVGSMIGGLFETTKSLLASEEDFLSLEESRIVATTGSLVEVLVQRSFLSDDILKHSAFEKFIQFENDAPSDLFACAALGGSLLRGLEYVLSRKDEMVETGDSPRVAQLSIIRNELWNVVTTMDCSRTEVHHSLRCPGLLLFGDLLRLSKEWNLEPWPDVATKNLTIYECLRSMTRDQSVNERAALSYVIACVARIDPIPKMKERIVDLVGRVRTRDYLMDASFCQLVRDFDPQELECLLDKLTNQNSSYPVDCQLRLVGLLLRYLEDENHVEKLSNFGREIFALVLKPLHASNPNESSWKENVIAASTLMGDLVRRRDVVSFKERDLALVLAHMSAVLGPGPSEEASNGPSPLENDVFDAMIGLFAALLQRFPKQLYICAPSVISVLHSFFRQVLYGPLADKYIVDRSQKFARICELFVHHQEVYKKHVLGLLLEFVHGLQQSMSLVRKKNLLPAVYCILDLLTPYETKQLNSLMDVTAKTLFRTIYQSYQKLHAYKGQ